MDRFQLSREFAYTKAKDEIQRETDPDRLKQMAIAMLMLNHGLKECIHKMAAAEIPEIDLPHKL